VKTKHGARRMADTRLLHGRIYNVQFTVSQYRKNNETQQETVQNIKCLSIKSQQ